MPHYLISSKAMPYRTLPFNVVSHSSEEMEHCTSAIILHQHEVLEINLLLEGEMFITVGEHRYHMKPGDAVLCNPFDIHSGDWADEGRHSHFLGFTILLSKMLGFPDSPLAENCSALLENRCRFDEFYPAGTSRIPELLQEMLAVYTEKSSVNECRALTLTYTLLEELFAGHFHTLTGQLSPHRNVDFMRSVAIFVQENYARDIGTADVAAAVYMEMSQFCHMFKRHFGVSFSNHLCRYRCIRAAELYKNSGMAIADIAAAVGFSDYCYFSRSFKKHIGQSPSRYFGKWH